MVHIKRSGSDLNSGMAQIEKRRRKQKDGELGPVRYRARVTSPMGERSKTFDKWADANNWAKTEEGKIAKGAWIDPRAGRQLLTDYARAWQEVQSQHRVTTAGKVDWALRVHVLPFFEGRPLAAVRPSEVKAWVKHRSKALAPSTLEVVYGYLAAIFRAAVEDRVIDVSPCPQPRKILPKPPKTEVIPPATAEVEAIMVALPDRQRAIAIVAAGAGLRSGEILGLTVDRIDFLRRTIRVDRQLVLPNSGAPYMGPPKTEASYRTVPVPTVVIDALAAHLAAFPAVTVELDDSSAGRPVKRSHDLVFTTAAREPIRRNRFGELWNAATARATIVVDGKRRPITEGIGPHDLRHYYASLLIRHGESVKTVQARLGHGSAMETLDTYAHLWPDDEDRTRDAIGEVLGTILGAPAHDRPMESAGP